MRHYHIRISLHRKTVLNTNAADNSDSEFIPTSLFQYLPAQKARSTVRRNATFNSSRKDYRFGPIRIDWVDFEDMNKVMNSGTGGKEKDSGASTLTCKVGVGAYAWYIVGPTTATFVPHTLTKSGSTNLPEGTVHIFRESTATPSMQERDASTSTLVGNNSESDGVMLGVLAVPAWMTPAEFLAFVAPAADGMAHLRIIRWVLGCLSSFNAELHALIVIRCPIVRL
jgi:BRCA1-associated protein